ncbi:TonB-dependent receptor [Myxococcus sp. K38C18041901]|uniref:TonB-dependent receptor n=1 Tax=Myxococcus guangdongensis TaxID=2906760 RepID=UPI0020A7DEF1|nr:TonB-dependent receptor [Myxococcus guangdongensis]MCP3059296.1 TonB-dependent receptor [Myxococcus guangdongensis]
MKNLAVSRLARVCGVVGVLVGVVLAPSARAAEATDVIVGKVVDAVSQLPVPEVVVTATTPELAGEQTVVTGVDGTYRIGSIPPGTYTLLFETEMYRPLRQTEVHKLAEQELRVDVLIEKEPPSDERGGCYFLVSDVTSAGMSTELFSELISGVLTQRPVMGRQAMRTLDGFLVLASNMVETRRGSTLLGTGPWENEYLLDGLSTRDAVTGRNALPLSLEFLQDTTVFTHGIRARYGRATGVVVEQSSASGSNEYSGTAFAEWVPGVLTERGPVKSRAGERPSRHSVFNQGEFGATLRGGLIKDRLWFFMGAVPALTRVERTPAEQAGGGRSFIDHRQVQALGRLTYIFNYDHDLSLMAVIAPSTSRWQDVDSTNQEVDRELSRVALDYRGAFFEKKLLVDAHAAWMGQSVTNLGLPREYRENEAPLSACGGPLDDWTMDCDARDQATNRYQASAEVVHLWYPGQFPGGSHLLKMGMEVEQLIHDWERGGQEATSRLQTHSGFTSAYVQDTWSPSDWLTFNAGLRYDTQSVGGRIHGGDAISHLLSPRLGVTMASTGWDQLRIFGSYARYHGRVPLGLLRPHLSTERGVANVRLDSSLTPPSTTEFVTGLEFAADSDTSVSVFHARRMRTTGLVLIQDTERGAPVLVNPGRGLGANLPAPRSRHDSVTLEVDRNFNDNWSMLLAYTWSRLQGATLEEQRGVLNRPHVLKLSGTRGFFHRDWRWGASVGFSYLGIAGAHGEGAEKRRPWMHNVDARLAVRYNVERRQDIEFHLDVLNAFDSQADDSLTSGHEAAVSPAYQTPRQVRLGARYAF